MKPKSKKYIIFFLVAYLLLRLPDIIGPKISTYWLHKAIEEAHKNNISISIHNYTFDSINSIKAERVLIESITNPQIKYLIDTVSIKLTGLLTPSLQLQAKLYEGTVDCALSSSGIYALLRSKKAELLCEIKSIQLQSVPFTGNLNILGILDASIESNLDANPKNITVKGETKILNGYLDFATSFCDPQKNRHMPDELKLACMTASKFPPIVNIELFTSLEYAENLIKVSAANSRSNYGLFKTDGIIKLDNGTLEKPYLDVKGTFTLSSISKEVIDPWITLINNGQKLNSENGRFSVQGVPPRTKVKIE